MSIETIASRAARATGSNGAVLLAFGLVLLWVVSGPYFHFSRVWQATINIGTSVVTFLMVFLIQNTQNRDARAMNLKLNELIRAIESARNQMIDIEHLSDSDLDLLAVKYEKLRSHQATPHKSINEVATLKS